MLKEDLLHPPGLEEGRERVGEVQTHRRAGAVQKPWRFDPAPGGPAPARQPPGGGQVSPDPPGLGDNLVAHQEAQFDPHSGETDAPPPPFAGGSQVMIPGQGLPAHPLSIVHHRQGGGHRVGPHPDQAGSRVQGVRHDLGEDRVLQAFRIRVPEVFQEVKEVDAGLAHGAQYGREGESPHVRACRAREGTTPGRRPAAIDLSVPWASKHLGGNWLKASIMLFCIMHISNIWILLSGADPCPSHFA